MQKLLLWSPSWKAGPQRDVGPLNTFFSELSFAKVSFYRPAITETPCLPFCPARHERTDRLQALRNTRQLHRRTAALHERTSPPHDWGETSTTWHTLLLPLWAARVSERHPVFSPNWRMAAPIAPSSPPTVSTSARRLTPSWLALFGTTWYRICSQIFYSTFAFLLIISNCPSLS